MIKTPNIDVLAEQGMRFTSFLTGRYRPCVNFGGATGSDGEGGLPDGEHTLAEGLKSAG